MFFVIQLLKYFSVIFICSDEKAVTMHYIIPDRLRKEIVL